MFIVNFEKESLALKVNGKFIFLQSNILINFSWILENFLHQILIRYFLQGKLLSSAT